MIRIGDYNELEVLRSTSVGVFLGDAEGTEILLPNKYVPKDIKLNDTLRVFCYLDHEERPVATTLKPYVRRDEFAFLTVAEVNNIGAFLDWGLEKQLLVPFKEQRIRMEPGKNYVVRCFLDEKSFRLMASAKTDKFFTADHPPFGINDEVEILVNRKTDLGWEVIVDNLFKGLVFFDDVFKTIEIGLRSKGYIKKVREDGKLDISLQPTGVKMLDSAATQILMELKEGDGFLGLHDKSSPEEIKEKLQMSKKSFKKGVGILYKQKKIVLLPDGIRLKS